MKPRSSGPIRADDRCLSAFIDLRQRTVEPVAWKVFRREWFRCEVADGIAVARQAAGATRNEAELVIVAALDHLPPHGFEALDRRIFLELARRGISRRRAVTVLRGMILSGLDAEVVR